MKAILDVIKNQPTLSPVKQNRKQRRFDASKKKRAKMQKDSRKGNR